MAAVMQRLPVAMPNDHKTPLIEHVEVPDSSSDSEPEAAPTKTGNGTTLAEPSATIAALDLEATHLISSPYSEFVNQLDLQELSTPYRLSALALTALRPVREDYATAPYLESFNWSEAFALLRALCVSTGYQWRELELYTVIFRSKLQEGIDRERLGLLDRKSHEEACASGGLLKYWFGTCNEERRNLATCLWRNREDAAAGGKGPWHAQARLAARTMYETISFHTHCLVVEDGATSWRLEEYKH